MQASETRSSGGRRWFVAMIGGALALASVLAVPAAAAGRPSAAVIPAAAGRADAPNPSRQLGALEHQVPALSQCGHATRNITGVDGTSVTIEGDPRRVVALEFSLADGVAAAGMRPVGIADDDKASYVAYLDDGLLGHYTSVGLRKSPNLEIISSLRPQLILADHLRDAKILSQLRSIAPTLSLQSLGAGYKSVLKTDLTIGAALNRCARVEAKLLSHIAAMDKIITHVPKQAVGQTVLFGVSVPDGFYAHVANEYEPEILQLLGLKSAIPVEPDVTALELTLEQVYAYRPDIIISGAYDPTTIVNTWSQAGGIWNEIPAVLHHRVFTVNGRLWATARSLASSEQIARRTVRMLNKEY